jgi:hypothetical protein
MQDSKKLKGWAKETSEIKLDGANIKNEIESMKTTIKTLQLEVERILKALDMKSYMEEFRERMDKVEKRYSHDVTLQ